jgi:hypothetical protein
MSDMVISETGEDAAAFGGRQGEVREDAAKIGKMDKKSRQEKSVAAGSGESRLRDKILRNNHHAKMLMAQELLQMGFSREAASRILNIRFSHE